VIENTDRFARISLDLSDFEKECNHYLVLLNRTYMVFIFIMADIRLIPTCRHRNSPSLDPVIIK